MATYYVNSGAGGTNTGGSWTDAYLTLAQAITAATASGDLILVHKTHTEELAADTGYAFGNNLSLIVVDKDSSDAASTMGTAAWVGNSTTNRSITFSGAYRVFIYGLTLRTAGSASDSINLQGSDGSHYEWDSCYLWSGNTSTSARISIGSAGAADVTNYNKCTNCTFRFGNTSQAIVLGRNIDIIGGSVSASGSTPTTLFAYGSNTVGATVTFHGFDMSIVTGTLIPAFTVGSPCDITFVQCKFGAAVTVLAAGSTVTRGSARVKVLDCNSGDTHISFGYYDAFGSLSSDTGVYFTSGAAAQSWKIDTTANASYRTPFVTPWIAFYNSATSAVTPYLEILRDGSTTAYNNDEVWGEFSAKITANVTLATVQSDRKVPNASAAAQANGAGLGSWTGESGTAWSGKVDSSTSMTPTEVGDIAGRICVGVASATVYIDPQVRT